MKLNFLKTLNLLTLVCLIGVVSCTDDFPYKTDPIPEGDGTLKATVTFTPTSVSDLGSSRTSGTAIQNIESLCVLVYDIDKNLVKKYSQGELTDYNAKKYNEGGAHQINANDHLKFDTDETETAQATFSIPGLPYGQYYIYAVANMGDLSYIDEKTGERKYYDVSTVENLQHITLNWNTDDISKNSQMFGYFTTADNTDYKGFDPEKPFTFTNQEKDSKIHAWLKRAASKVTVAFDPSGLNQGVTIYVRNVTIRDIPTTCLLGAENTPSSVEDLYNHLASYEDPDYTQTKPSDVVKNSRLEYDKDGVIINDGHTGSSSTDGLRLDNSIRGSWPENAHAKDAPSLFFYENNQNPSLIKADPNYKDNPDYDKRPQTKGDDEVGSTIHKPENIKDKNKINDFKDRVPLGTYVEVEAYYISSNPANPGEGTIKYRFMLGKDISFDYDAERNYHYKLTLGFKGWANDPDWHIDYVITTPSIEVPSVFRVSYLYMQKSELPIKIVGNIKYLTVTITENNWAPYDLNTTQTADLGSGKYKKSYLVPAEVIETNPNTYKFQWNRDAFTNSIYQNPSSNNPEYNDYPDNLPPGQQRPEFGFLALHLLNRNTTAVPSTEKNGYGPKDNNSLIKYWKDHLEGERRFSNVDGNTDFTIGTHNKSWGDTGHSFPEEDNNYTVKEIKNDNNVSLENQRILMLPVWTRTKSLVGVAGFSGNNPYEAFERKAVLHIAGVFDMGQGVDEKRIEKDVEVYQVKRLTNPKGVWRAHDRKGIFNVTLLEPVNSNAESNFQAFISQGEWTAFIDESTTQDAQNVFSIRPNGETNGYMENGVIHGNTGSEIHFAITFDGKVDEKESKCAIIKVLYHGNQCMHKILVRKGYNEPLEMGDPSNKKKWSSFSLYQATSTGETEEEREVFNAVLTKNPLMLGSMFRRGRQEQGIFVWNNIPDNNLGPFVAPGNKPFVIGQTNTGVTVTPGVTGEKWRNQWEESTWSNIGFDDVTTTANKEHNLGLFYALDDEGNKTTDTNGKTYKYRVPTYKEFQELTDNSEFGFGVFYGSSATAPKLNAEEAYGLIDPYNEGLFDDPNGMRAVVAYDKSTGNQILFPVGRYGIGVRRMFNLRNIGGGESYYNTFAGNLHYSDVYQPLSGTNDLYRPIPYNLPIVSGCIYWIDQYVDAGTYNNVDPCLGWDINYFNFDFNAYTANNWRDACPIKFVIDEE